MPAIKADNISKMYRFYRKPAHRLLESVLRRPMHTAFSALEDISFSVDYGTTLGIIGENGAGKSTLLKILARTLTPSTGSLEINGRVAALLELGAGFHQEFTGRQNIYLNASLMGLTEKEIKARERNIIEFAGIGDFIDRPIKTYSSGMAVRLGFSIATSVEPDILVVDEALSVGDQRFQDKCIKRMKGFIEAGKTIVVCSHSMYLINELCSESLWLENGRIRKSGVSDEVISSYLAFVEQKNSVPPAEVIPSMGTSEVVVEKITFMEQGDEVNQISQFSRLEVRVDTRCLIDVFYGHLAMVLEDQNNNHIFSAITRDLESGPLKFEGKKTVYLTFPRICLQKGSFRIKAIVTDADALRVVCETAAGPLSIVSDHPEYGLLWMEHEWKL